MKSWEDLTDNTIMYWRNHSSSTWALFCVALALVIVGTCFHRHKTQYVTPTHPVATDAPGVNKQALLDSSFFAYLGHNAITESSAQNPSNTSSHAINRVSERMKLRRGSTPIITDEPQSDDSDQVLNTTTSGQWRNHSYPDSPNRQVSFDQSQSMHDDDNGRSWQRRTLYVCGV